MPCSSAQAHRNLENEQVSPRHLLECSTCRSSADAHHRIAGAIGELGKDSHGPRPDWQARVWARIEDGTHSKIPARFQLVVIVATCALLLLSVGIQRESQAMASLDRRQGKALNTLANNIERRLAWVAVSEAEQDIERQKLHVDYAKRLVARARDEGSQKLFEARLVALEELKQRHRQALARASTM
jgi:hypothetical protein